MNTLSLNLPLPLPSWLPNETLYSLVSRYHIISGGRTPSVTCQTLFGHYRLGSQHDLPSRIGEFCARTHDTLGDARSIILTRTLLSFYLPLQSPQEAESAIQSMVGIQSGMLKFRLGILTSRFRANHPLKACSLCMAEDLDSHGVAYWHLEHQYPGVWMCIRHNVLLNECTVKTNGVARFGWVLPRTEELHPLSLIEHEKSADALLRFAELVLRWSTLPAGTHLPAELLARTYRSALHNQWGAEAFSRLDMSALAASHCAAIAPLRTVPELSGLPASAREASHQLHRWLLSPRGGTHPLRHLAIIYWLFPTWDAFWQRYQNIVAEPAASPTSTVPIPPPADPRRERLISLLRSGKSVTHCAKVIGVDVKTAMFWAASAGYQTSRRPKLLTDEILRGLIGDLRRGMDKTATAQKYSVSVETITRVLRTEVGLQDAWHTARHEDARMRSRNSWLSTISEAPGLGVKLLRTMEPAAYAWLYRNDRDWLQEHTAAIPTHRGNGSENRVDWDARDHGLSNEVRRVSEQLFRTMGQRTIMLWQLCQALPELKAKLSVLHRLPLTTRAIEDVTKRRKRGPASSPLL